MTISRVWTRRWLRGEAAFAGAVITDWTEVRLLRLGLGALLRTALFAMKLLALWHCRVESHVIYLLCRNPCVLQAVRNLMCSSARVRIVLQDVVLGFKNLHVCLAVSFSRNNTFLSSLSQRWKHACRCTTSWTGTSALRRRSKRRRKRSPAPP